MTALSEVRQKYPQYNDLSDQELADKYHAKYYSDLPKNEFYSKIGLSSEAKKEEPTSIFEDIAISTAKAIPELASMAINLPGEIYGAASHPLRTLKNIPIGLAEGAAGAFNFPGNITRYAANKGYLPESFGKYAPHIPIEKIEEKLGLLPKEPGDALTRGVSGFGLLGKIGRFGEASNLKRAGLGASYSGGAEQNPITGAILSSLPGLIKGGKKAYGYLSEPKRALNESKEALESIRHLLSEQKQTGEAQQNGVSQFMNQVQEGLTNRQKNLQSQLPELFPIKPLSETRKNISLATNSAITHLTKDFDNRYNDYYNKYGANTIHEPFEWHHVNLDNLPHVSMTTRKMGYDVSNDQLHYENSDGTKVTINFPADNASVRDYIDFSREVRDAAWDASKAAKNATYGEAKSLRKTSTRLRQLQGEAEEKIKNTVGEEHYKEYRQIQEDYSHLMGPVKTEPALFNAAYRKKISDKLHNTLLQPANEHIRSYLYERPEFTNAIREHLMQGTKHPLLKGAMVNPAAIDSDLQYLLTPEQKAAQAEQLQLHEAQEHLNQVSNHLRKPETITPQQAQQVRAFHPKTASYLSDEAQRSAIRRELERQQSEHKMTKEERERQLFNRRATLGTLGTVLTLSQSKNILKLIKKLF